MPHLDEHTRQEKVRALPAAWRNRGGGAGTALPAQHAAAAQRSRGDAEYPARGDEHGRRGEPGLPRRDETAGGTGTRRRGGAWGRGEAGPARGGRRVADGEVEARRRGRVGGGACTGDRRLDRSLVLLGICVLSQKKNRRFVGVHFRVGAQMKVWAGVALTD